MRTTALPDVAPGEISDWFLAKLPAEWQVLPAELTIDDDEILVVLTIEDVAPTLTDTDAQTAARLAAMRVFREDTRIERGEIGSSAEARFSRRVSWGVRCEDSARLFTHLSMPTMTRLRIKERMVLDTLIEGGVARSRSDALAWCVRIVGRNLDEWLVDLRDALAQVDDVRRRGPNSPEK